MDSWSDQFQDMISRGGAALENLNLCTWWELTNTFAMLTPMLPAQTKTFLRMLERGIPTVGGEPHLTNGCTVHWDKVSHHFMRCWCEDFHLRSLCFHTLLWLVDCGWVSAPAKWGGGRGLQVTDTRGRPTHFHAGSVSRESHVLQ